MRRLLGILAVVAAGCGGGGGGSGDEEGGSGSWPAPSGSIGSYTYQLHVPPSYTGAAAVPLLVAMHGTGGHGSGMVDAWRALADANGFLILAPNYRENETYFTPEGDAAILAMIAEVQASYTIDGHRIYLNGVSTGGSWSFVFGLEHSTEIAAASVIAGGYTGDNELMVQSALWPVAFHLSHGFNDTTFPVENARSARDALLAHGHPVQYDEHGEGHSAPAGSYAAAWAFLSGYALP